jgi:hypothetical protein
LLRGTLNIRSWIMSKTSERTGKSSRGAAWLAAVAVVSGGACAQVLGLEEWHGGSTSGGGSSVGTGGASSSASSASGGGCGPCGMPPTECKAYVCAPSCMLVNLPAGTQTATQPPGDCKDYICDADGGVTATINNSDMPDGGADGGPCQVAACVNGVPSLAPRTPGSPCGDAGTCDWMGMCDPCAMALPCKNTCLDGAETDIDCGGNTCSQCGQGQHCNKPLDCSSNICDLATKVCL